MRKNYIVVLRSALVAVFALFLCFCAGPQNAGPDSGEPIQKAPLREVLSLNNARVFFTDFEPLASVIPAGPTRSETDEVFPDPVWEEARYSEFLGHEVIEVPFDEVYCSVYREDDDALSRLKDNLPPPFNTAIKLISGVDGWGEIWYRVVHITPEASFLSERDISLEELSLEHTTGDFSGTLGLFEITGEFVKGFRLSGGEIVRTLSGKSSGAASGGYTRSDPECITYQGEIFVQWPEDYWDAELGIMGSRMVGHTIRYSYEYCVSPPGGGDTDPGIDPNPNPPTPPKPKTPKVDKLVNKSNLTDDQQKKLEEQLEKVSADCMGEALFNALANDRTGRKLTVMIVPELGNRGQYKTEGIILLGTLEKSADILFHEMWHAYQQMQGEDMSFQNLNLEVEAHLAQYLYLKRQGLVGG